MQPKPNVKAAAVVFLFAATLAFASPAGAQQQESGANDAAIVPSVDESQSAPGGPLAFIASLFGGSASDTAEQDSKEAAQAEIGASDGGEDAATVRAVELMALSRDRNALLRTFFGQVRARETADLSFGVGGTLERLPVAEGAVIEDGAMLAALDLAPFERAVERAALQLDQTERALTRAESLVETSVGTQTRADDARTARDLADVALREARDALEDAVIAAPYRALIAERLAANYTSVEPGTPIVRVHDISQMRVEIDLPERLVQQVPVRDRERVEFTARLPGSATPTVLELVEFHAQTEAVGQSYLFTFALPASPPESPSGLLPGSSLTVTARLPVDDRSVVLPPTAIVVNDERTPYVMVFEPADDTGQGGPDSVQGTVRAVPVEVSSANGTNFIVRGLPEDVELVRVGAHLLRDGQDVRRYTGLKSED